jgi:methylphosphotriester-DNA--protein-cysteine methyltransferase
MILHNDIHDRTLRGLIREGSVSIAGNRKLKIYGRLNCSSGMRMRREHRVFFSSDKEAIDEGYRPCGNCMKDDYKIWKRGE